jgi:hypothetical protein
MWVETIRILYPGLFNVSPYADAVPTNPSVWSVQSLLQVMPVNAEPTTLRLSDTASFIDQKDL